MQADFGDEKMEVQPSSLPEEGDKSPTTKNVVDETMPDASSKKDEEEKSKSATKSVNKMTLLATPTKSGSTPLFGSSWRGTQTSWSIDGR